MISSKMITAVLFVVLGMSGVAKSYDCYDQKCEGTGSYYDIYVYCDQATNYCTTNYDGYPECTYNAYGGNGVYCYGDYYCDTYSNSGQAYCNHYGGYNYEVNYIWIIGGPSLAVLIIICSCCFCWRRRRRNASATVIQNINVQPRAVPAYPPNPGYAPNPGPGYGPNPGPGYAPNHGPGYAPNPGPGYAPNPGPGYAPNPGPGYGPNPGPGYAPSPGPGYAPNPGPGYAPNPASGYAQNPAPGYAPNASTAPPPYSASEKTALLKTPAVNPKF